MKTVLDDTIRSFSREEFRQFKYFLSRNKTEGKQPWLKTADAIRKGEQTHKTTNTDRQARKRLKMQLEQFFDLENLKHEPSSKIHNLIESSKYLFRKNLNKHAWDYLMKAEQMAQDAEKYELLNAIYNIQVSYSSTVYLSDISVPDIGTILEKQKQNFLLSKTFTDANAAYALVLSEIRKRLTTNPHFDINDLVDKIFKQFDLDTKIHDNPRIYFKTVKIVCMALFWNKDYEKLKLYAINHYRLMFKKKLLKKIDFDSLIELLKAIINSTLRTKDYKTSKKFLDILRKQIEPVVKHKDESHMYYDFYAAGFAIEIYLCTNKLDQARHTVLALNNNFRHITQSARIYFILRINLIVIYFAGKEYAKCIKIYNAIMQQKKEKLIKFGGIEMALFSELYAVLFYYDQDDIDFAYYLLNAIKKRYLHSLSKSDFKREADFIRILYKMINNASYIESKIFKKDVHDFIKLKNFIPGDKEYISLNAWLTSKLTGKTYYECFLEIVQ